MPKSEEGAMVVEPFFWRRHGLLRETIVQQSLGSFFQKVGGGEIWGA